MCCWRRPLKVPWSTRRSKQSILREINSEYSWKDWHGSSSMLAIWCEQLTHWKSHWCWERLKAEGEEGIRGWDGWMASPIQCIWTWGNFGRWWRMGWPGVLQYMGLKELDTTGKLNNNYIFLCLVYQFSSVAQLCPTLCDPMKHSTPGLFVYRQLQESTQTHVHRVNDAIQPSHPLSSSSPPALNTRQNRKWLKMQDYKWKIMFCREKVLFLIALQI